MRFITTLLLFSFSFLFSIDYYVETTGIDNASCSVSNPCEHIQTAINLTSDGDVVIVSGGTYLENLLIETGITLKSADATDPAIIDGSAPETDPALWNGGSCIVIRTPRGTSSRVTATVEDVHLTGGKGTVIIEDTNHDGDFDDPEDEIKIVGGGMIIHNAGLLSMGNKIMNNGDSSTKEGGAVYAAGTGANIPDDQPADPPDYNLPNERSVIVFEGTTFSGNDAQIGHTVMVNGWGPENRFIDIDFGSSHFDCIFDSDNNELDGVSEYWVKGKDSATFDFSGGITGEVDAILTDVWVDPVNGEDEDNLTGNEGNPFLTIDYAMSMIYQTEDNPITIHLTAGEFSPSNTDMTFPIIMQSHLNLIGAGEEITIINAEQTNRVLVIYNCQNNFISNLTITGSQLTNQGGGIRINDSNPTITHVTIRGNTANWGAGIYATLSQIMLINVNINDNVAIFGVGGIYSQSEIILNHVNISGNIGGGMIAKSHCVLNNVNINANIGSWHPGILLEGFDITLNNVTISNNVTDDPWCTSCTGGIYISQNGNVKLTNVTITGNIAGENGMGGIFANWDSHFTLTNSIVWDNYPEEIAIYSVHEETIITYSNIEGGFDGDGNIDIDPLFANPENADYSLSSSSPCIDSGDPSLWFQDIDGTRADLGATGGLYAFPNFTNHDFGEVGYIESSIQFTLYNYRNTFITISSVSFETSSFTFSSNTNFPIIIEPHQTAEFNIEANNSFIGYIEDEMELVSLDLPEGLSVSLSVTGTEDNTLILTGNLSGVYPADTYRISGDITIESGDSVQLEPGTQFLFDEGINFNIYGVIQAIGTETDSIIFDKLSDENWNGFILEGVSDQSVFKYVRISAGEKTLDSGSEFTSGGGLYLSNSHPSFNHVVISGNTSGQGGGIYLEYSNPSFTYVAISNNTANAGGGIYSTASNPTFDYVNIIDNIANQYGGISIAFGNSTFNHVTISRNIATSYGIGGISFFGASSNTTFSNIIISDNIAEGYYGIGGMMLAGGYLALINVTISGNVSVAAGALYLANANPTFINSIIWDNGQESIRLENTEEPIFLYSNIESGWEGEGNIDVDPLFTDSENGDYTLQEGSPCIDAGIADLWEVGYGGVITDYNGQAPDMGAYEFEGSSLTGDLNGDGLLNILDVVILVNIVLGYGEPVDAGDLNGDGFVSVIDIVLLVNIILEE